MIRKTKHRLVVGGQAQDIFSSTEKQPLAESPESMSGSSRGRPKELPANVVKSTVTFYNSQIVWLDRLSASIREKSKSVVDRSAIIRAILSAVEESKFELSEASSEEEIRDQILQKLIL